ncbi:MAG: hypothetical protein N2690_05730 [Rhodocyclaceae bacterium]|nr:hypothetical protein [Rhodocyclaceae bacterium]
MAEAWFERKIRRGLAALVALRMDGQPPADAITATARVWIEALWPGRVWVESLDAERIGEAFRQIVLHETRWPTPAVFLRYLPARQPQTALPSPRQTAEQKLRARAILAEIAKRLRHGGSDACGED